MLSERPKEKSGLSRKNHRSATSRFSHWLESSVLATKLWVAAKKGLAYSGVAAVFTPAALFAQEKPDVDEKEIQESYVRRIRMFRDAGVKHGDETATRSIVSNIKRRTGMPEREVWEKYGITLFNWAVGAGVDKDQMLSIVKRLDKTYNTNIFARITENNHKTEPTTRERRLAALQEMRKDIKQMKKRGMIESEEQEAQKVLEMFGEIAADRNELLYLAKEAGFSKNVLTAVELSWKRNDPYYSPFMPDEGNTITLDKANAMIKRAELFHDILVGREDALPEDVKISATFLVEFGRITVGISEFDRHDVKKGDPVLLLNTKYGNYAANLESEYFDFTKATIGIDDRNPEWIKIIVIPVTDPENVNLRVGTIVRLFAFDPKEKKLYDLADRLVVNFRELHPDLAELEKISLDEIRELDHATAEIRLPGKALEDGHLVEDETWSTVVSPFVFSRGKDGPVFNSSTFRVGASIEAVTIHNLGITKIVARLTKLAELYKLAKGKEMKNVRVAVRQLPNPESWRYAEIYVMPLEYPHTEIEHTTPIAAYVYDRENSRIVGHVKLLTNDDFTYAAKVFGVSNKDVSLLAVRLMMEYIAKLEHKTPEDFWKQNKHSFLKGFTEKGIKMIRKHLDEFYEDSVSK